MKRLNGHGILFNKYDLVVNFMKLNHYTYHYRKFGVAVKSGEIHKKYY